MKSITGAIVLLAAAVLFGCGVIAEALTAERASGSVQGRQSMVGGVFLGLVGLAMIAAKDKPQPPERG